MSEERDCVVKLIDDHGVEHSVRVRAESVYEAALKEMFTNFRERSARISR